jgi:hypothetical protein
MTVLGGMSSVKLKNLKGSMFRPKLGNRPATNKSPVPLYFTNKSPVPLYLVPLYLANHTPFTERLLWDG